MKAGPELDALVAERVMGLRFWLEDRGGYAYFVGVGRDGSEPWTKFRGAEEHAKRYRPATISDFDRQHHIMAPDDLIPAYSREIAAAWMVVEKMLTRPAIRFSLYYGDHCRPTARFFHVPTGDDLAMCHADTAPLAICLAALAALEKGRT